jgi:hypothetical protein
MQLPALEAAENKTNLKVAGKREARRESSRVAAE